MERPSNQVLREFSEEAKRASKENDPPPTKTLGSPINSKAQDTYRKLSCKKSLRTDGSETPARMILNEPNADRHVTFDVAPTHRGLATVHPAFRPHRKPPPGRTRAATALDLQAGSMEAVECFPQQLKVSKHDPAFLQQRLEELTRENGRLQQELLYHQDTLAVMNGFFVATRRAHHDLQNAIAETARKVAISEERLLDCYGRQPFRGGYEDNVF